MIFAFLLLLQAAAAGAVPDCAPCHRSEAATAGHSQMSGALRRASASEFLRDHPDLKFSSGRYAWSIRTREGVSSYSVTDGQSAIAAPIVWAFGAGVVGQTYMAERGGSLYELPISYYPTIKTVDWTLGHSALPRATLEQAFGRKIGPDEARRCFGCHSAATVRTGAAQPESLAPGVQCGQCHANASQHAIAVTKGDGANARIAKLSALGAEELGAVCAGCHQSWAETAANGPRGVLNVRAQLYRLTNSRCYDAEDGRISCTACHDPHSSLVTDLSYYDRKCGACHTSNRPAGSRPIKMCPIAKENCVSCHMPKVEIPGLHFAFADHQIRIVRPGDKYPE